MIQDIHKTYGHGGVQCTSKLFKECFTPDHTLKYIKEIISKCNVCQRCKDNNQKNLGETKAIVPTAKGELINCDYYGPLVTSTAGVRYIFVMVNNFTKFIKLYAMKKATTRATINRVRQYVQTFGTPNMILTDNGTQFTMEKWTKGLADKGIKPKLTAIRNPRTNSAERINRQLGNMFRVFTSEQHTCWAKYLNIIETH